MLLPPLLLMMVKAVTVTVVNVCYFCVVIYSTDNQLLLLIIVSCSHYPHLPHLLVRNVHIVFLYHSMRMREKRLKNSYYLFNRQINSRPS